MSDHDEYSYDWRPYDNPAKHGLTKVAELDFSSGSYEFDITAVFWDGKQFVWGDDSGCSCPSPFEGFADLAAFEHGNYERLQIHLTKRAVNSYGNYVRIEQVQGALATARRIARQGGSPAATKN